MKFFCLSISFINFVYLSLTFFLYILVMFYIIKEASILDYFYVWYIVSGYAGFSSINRIRSDDLYRYEALCIRDYCSIKL
jgi:hypothetical protein